MYQNASDWIYLHKAYGRDWHHVAFLQVLIAVLAGDYLARASLVLGDIIIHQYRAQGRS